VRVDDGRGLRRGRRVGEVAVKVALVTGASGGLGAAIVRAFRKAGMQVAAVYRKSRVKAERLARECGCVPVRGDVAKDADRIVAATMNRFGRLDVLVNAAGVSDPAGWADDLNAVTPRLWGEVMATDLWGTFACARAAARVMKRGEILNVASLPALVGDRDGIVYATAKAGIVGLTKSLAVLLAPRIRVNCMAFGSMETGWVGWLTPSKRREYLRAIPLGRFGRPEEAAELALFLAGNDFVTGQTVVLDGGEARV
jgi:3-oxoacyl-[acyl-carrier protein] reductase